MSLRNLNVCLAAIVLVVLHSAATVTAARAHDYTVRGLTIDHPWARPTPGGAKTAAFYLKLVNKSDEADTLVSAASERGAKIEIHETTVTDGVAKMRRVEAGLAVAANSTVALEPSGLHLMVLGLEQPLKDGDRVPLQLTFKNRGTVKVVVNVEVPKAASSDAKPAAKAHEHHHHHH